MSPQRVATEVDDQELSLSNLEKVLYPETGFTKGEMIHYYAQIAEVMLPHIKDRPMTLKRYVHGVNGESFFEKHAPLHRPDWIRTARIPHGFSSPPGGKIQEDIEYLVVNDRPTLIWAANLATIEFHVPLWRVGKNKKIPGNSDHMVFDLDPGPGTTIVDCCRVARLVTDRVDQDLLFAKTSGSKGLQLYMRLNGVAAERSSAQAHDVARAIETDHPNDVVSNMRKELRKGKVLIDWSQNNPAKTTVSVYSLRARPEPTVSTPVTWDEVDACVKSGNPDDLRFVASDVLERVGASGDLFEGLIAKLPRRPTKGSTK